MIWRSLMLAQRVEHRDTSPDSRSRHRIAGWTSSEYHRRQTGGVADGRSCPVAQLLPTPFAAAPSRSPADADTNLTGNARSVEVNPQLDARRLGTPHLRAP